MEATGKSQLSSGEASADLQEILQLLGIHRVILTNLVPQMQSRNQQ